MGPQGNIFIEYKYGAKENHVIARFELDLFHQKHTLINYAIDIRFINRVLLHSFLSKFKKDMVSLRKDGENVNNIDDIIKKIIKDKEKMNLKQFGGLITIQKNGEYLKLTPFHSPKYRKQFESFQQKMIQIKSESIEESTTLEIHYQKYTSTLYSLQLIQILFGSFFVEKIQTVFCILESGKESILNILHSFVL